MKKVANDYFRCICYTPYHFVHLECTICDNGINEEEAYFTVCNDGQPPLWYRLGQAWRHIFSAHGFNVNEVMLRLPEIIELRAALGRVAEDIAKAEAHLKPRATTCS